MRTAESLSLYSSRPHSRQPHLAALLRDDGLRTLHGRKKLRHILTYYKFPLVVLGFLLYFFGSNLYHRLTQKDVLLYTALVNVTTGETLTKTLEEDFLDHLDADASAEELELYTGLYLTDDELNAYHEYTYASRMKILSAIEGQLMDVVLMNKEAFDAFSQNGYLHDLDSFLSDSDPALYESLKPALVSNIVILEDNADDLALDPSLPYQALTEEHCYGLDLSGTRLIRQAGFEDTVYLGVIANTPRAKTATEYIRWITANGRL